MSSTNNFKMFGNTVETNYIIGFLVAVTLIVFICWIADSGKTYSTKKEPFHINLIDNNLTKRFCSNCGILRGAACSTCSNCGFCYDKNGQRTCVPGDRYGPLNGKHCDKFVYTDTDTDTSSVYEYNDPAYMDYYYDGRPYWGDNHHDGWYGGYGYAHNNKNYNKYRNNHNNDRNNHNNHNNDRNDRKNDRNDRNDRKNDRNDRKNDRNNHNNGPRPGSPKK
jgi:hypothetical protein